MEQDRVKGESAAEGLEGGGFIVEGASGDFVDFEARSGLDDVLDTGGVVDAGKLDEDLRRPDVVLLDDGLGDAEGVDAGADDVNRLVEGARLERRDSAGLHGQGEPVQAVRLDVIVIAVAVREQSAGIVLLVGRDAVDVDGRRLAVGAERGGAGDRV